MPTERILVVDDDPAILMLCHRIMEADGYQVVDAKRGEDALAKLESESFDLLLTDIRLPGLNGLDVTQRLRERNSELTVVTMTGYSNMEMAIQALSLGVDEFLVKPFTPESLRIHVARALEKSRLRRENLRLRTLEPLLQTAQSFAAGRTREQVYQELFAATSGLFRTDEMFVLAANAETECYVVGAAQGQVFASFPEQSVSAVEWKHHCAFLEDGTKVWSEQAQHHLPFGADDIGWVVATLIQTGGETQGILYIAVRQPPTAADMEALHLIAAQAAIALTNVDLLGRISLAYQNVRKVEQLKSEFLNIAAHELRTPLSVLRGYASLLHNMLKDEPQEYARQVLDCADRLQQIADDMLELKYLEAGHIDLHVESCAIDQVVKEVVDSYRELALEREQSIAIDIEKESAGQVKADRAMLNMMLGSLLTNAIKFSPRNSLVRVFARGDDEQVTLVVQDQGKGLTPEQSVHVFDPFYQADNSLTRKEGGLGLGLTLTHKMVDAHGGKIWVESDYNHGSLFYISLPRETAKAQV